MGTRHLIVVVYRGRWWIAQYGQWDGYPDVVGFQLVGILAAPGFPDELRAGLPHTYEPDENTLRHLLDDAQEASQILDHLPAFDPATQELRDSQFQVFRRDPLNHYAPELLDMVPSVHRDTSAAVLVLAARATAEKPLPLQLQPEFANDGLFCEWSYVVDLDADLLEVYEGASRKTPGHRFANVGPENASVPTFITSVPFTRLNTYRDDRGAFVAMINEEIDAINRRRAESRQALDE
ncbi:hypothetical protein ISF_03633 [Cordyceps fumosorosea ARSEF 2679]|uniref:Uncharacterized protein n=1 Tax=Cordyceps fumosorosea (strain ARSEF 2679) TaxID=1081104 RepID=A0A167ZFL4_CORFA|nr:hypothetical protein ISF_03633 [Cordyceps fumosorosea ARSEF 2679]OAA67457.1 hypothetical protein ISF_03633 [Cordyceps fumosorosea ARSEF 2679]